MQLPWFEMLLRTGSQAELEDEQKEKFPAVSKQDINAILKITYPCRWKLQAVQKERGLLVSSKKIKTVFWLQVVILPNEYSKTLTDCVFVSHKFSYIPLGSSSSNK